MTARRKSLNVIHRVGEITVHIRLHWPPDGDPRLVNVALSNAKETAVRKLKGRTE